MLMGRSNSSPDFGLFLGWLAPGDSPSLGLGAGVEAGETEEGRGGGGPRAAQLNDGIEVLKTSLGLMGLTSGLVFMGWLLPGLSAKMGLLTGRGFGRGTGFGGGGWVLVERLMVPSPTAVVWMRKEATVDMTILTVLHTVCLKLFCWREGLMPEAVQVEVSECVMMDVKELSFLGGREAVVIYLNCRSSSYPLLIRG
jgi:hypothetical protein